MQHFASNHAAPLLACLLLTAGSVSAQTWDTTRPPMPATRLDYAASVAEKGGENQIFVFGGVGGLSTSDDVYVYHSDISRLAPPGDAGRNAVVDVADAVGLYKEGRFKPVSPQVANKVESLPDLPHHVYFTNL